MTCLAMLLASPPLGATFGSTAWPPSVAWRAVIPSAFLACSQRTCRPPNYERSYKELIEALSGADHHHPPRAFAASRGTAGAVRETVPVCQSIHWIGYQRQLV